MSEPENASLSIDGFLSLLFISTDVAAPEDLSGMI
jgi:hypothetical protein